MGSQTVVAQLGVVVWTNPLLLMKCWKSYTDLVRVVRRKRRLHRAAARVAWRSGVGLQHSPAAVWVRPPRQD